MDFSPPVFLLLCTCFFVVTSSWLVLLVYRYYNRRRAGWMNMCVSHVDKRAPCAADISTTLAKDSDSECDRGVPLGDSECDRGVPLGDSECDRGVPLGDSECDRGVTLGDSLLNLSIGTTSATTSASWLRSVENHQFLPHHLQNGAPPFDAATDVALGSSPNSHYRLCGGKPMLKPSKLAALGTSSEVTSPGNSNGRWRHSVLSLGYSGGSEVTSLGNCNGRWRQSLGYSGGSEVAALGNCNGRWRHSKPVSGVHHSNDSVFQLMNGLSLREPAGTPPSHVPPDNLNWRGRKKLRLPNGISTTQVKDATHTKDSSHLLSAKTVKRRVGGNGSLGLRGKTSKKRFCGRTCLLSLCLSLCLLASLAFNGVLVVMFLSSPSNSQIIPAS